MSVPGFVPIKRSVIETRWYSDSEVRALVLNLALTVNHKIGYFDGTVVNPGERIVSMQRLADEMGWKKTKTFRVLARAEEYGGLVKKSERRWTKLILSESIIYDRNDKSSGTNPELKCDTDGSEPASKRKQSNNENQSNNEDHEKKRGTQFVPPTIGEVQAYCDERQNNINPEKFIDYYESRGWYLGQNLMKDWKAAVRIWEKNEKTFRSKESSRTDPFAGLREFMENDSIQ